MGTYKNGGGSAIVSVDCQFVKESRDAVLIKSDRDKEIWLPKSKIELDDGSYDEFEVGQDITLHVPVWLATEEGLV